jgi:hypothetical protein
MHTLLRLSNEILRATAALVLGISALVIVWLLFFALLSLVNPNWASELLVIRPPPEGGLYSSLHGIFDTWVVLLGMVAPTWILARLPFYPVCSRWSPWKISNTIFAAGLGGGVGGAIECVRRPGHQSTISVAAALHVYRRLFCDRSHDRGGGGRDLEMLLANQWGRRWPYKKLLAK